MNSSGRMLCITASVACCCIWDVSYAFVSPAGTPGRHAFQALGPTAGAVPSTKRAAGYVALRPVDATERNQPRRRKPGFSVEDRSRAALRSTPSESSSEGGVEEPATDGAAGVATAELVEVGGMETGDPATRSKLKAELVRKVATLNRGFVAQEADRLDVEEIIEMLELENPNPKPCTGFETQTSPIEGYWRLLYTTSLDVLSLQVNPAVTIGQIFQKIEPDGRSIQNIIELQPPFAAVSNRILGSSLVTLTVKLESEPVSDTRIDLKFVRTEIKANSVFGRELDLPALGVDIPSGDKLQEFLKRGQERVKEAKKKARGVAKELESGGDAGEGEVEAEGTGGEPASVGTSDASGSRMKPFFETTYVDDDLRVGRTGSGDLFVSTRA